MAANIIDLNCDMGESFGVYKLGMDEEVINYISSANIACGFHAGDHNVMQTTVRIAAENEAGIGAHPAFPDLNGFGRRKMDIDLEEIKNLITYQIGSLSAFAKARNRELQHVKPHGALYNMASSNYDLAAAAAEAVKKIDEDLIFVALGGTKLYKAAEDIGLRVAFEAFADRAYSEDGTLASRSEEGAVLEDSRVIKKRVVKMITENEVRTISGNVISVNPDTICVHGDNPEALEIVREVVKEIKKSGIEIKPMAEFL